MDQQISPRRFRICNTLQGRRWLMERRIEAVENNDTLKLRELLSSQMYYHPKELTSALEVAILKKSDCFAACVCLLLNKGANPCGTSGSGTPFLLMAADAGCLQVLQLLIEADCDVDMPREDGATALHRAAWNNHVPCMEALIKVGAETNPRDSQGRTPLMLAVQKNHRAAVTSLLDQGANPNVRDIRQRTPLHVATAHYNRHVIGQLLDAGSDVNAADTELCTPLMIAAEKGDFHTLEMLLENDHCKLDEKNSRGDCALLLAAVNDNLECACALAAYGADVNATNRSRASALIHVVHEPRAVRYLLGAGACPNVVTSQGITPLWLAVSNGHAGSMLHLLRANSDPTGGNTSQKHKPPLQTALYEGNLQITKLLYLATVAWQGYPRWLGEYLDSQAFQDRCRRCKDSKDCREWVEERMTFAMLQGQKCDSNSVPVAEQRLLTKEQGQITKQVSFHSIVFTHELGYSLTSLCRRVIRQAIGDMCTLEKIEKLPLPPSLRGFVNLLELDDAGVILESDEEYYDDSVSD